MLKRLFAGAAFGAALVAAGAAEGKTAALPMPSGKATAVAGLGKGDVATNCIPVRVGNVVTALNKRLEIDSRSGRLTLVIDDDTAFTCGESYCFVDGKTGAKSWGAFATGPRARKWHSRIEAREEDGAYVTEAYLKTSSGEESLQNRTTLKVLPDGLVQATFEGFPSRDESIVRIDNPDGLYFGGGKKTLPGSRADFGGKVVAFDDEPSVKVDYNGRWSGAKDFPIVYYKDDPVREFALTLTKGMSGSVGWGVWTKDVLHGSFSGGGKKTVLVDLRRGVKRAPNPNVRGGIDWQAIEDLEMPERRRNIVENASFERGWRCWDSFRFGMGGVTPVRWNTEFFAIDGEVAHSGRRSLRCRVLECAETAGIYGLESMSTSLCPVPEPGRYTASFWAKATHTNVVASVWCPSFLYCTSWKTVSRWMPKTKACMAKLPLTTEWKRYSFTFDLPESDPFKLLFSFAAPEGGGEGVAWVDDVQVEKGGEATPFEPPAAEAELVMSDPDQFCDPDLPLDARLAVCAARAGEVDVEVKSFLGEPIFARTYSFEPRDGRATVALDGLEAALPGSGVYRMKRTFRLVSGETAFEHDRFTLAKSLDGVPRKWRFLQLDYGDPMENACIRRELARWRRIGIDRLYGPQSGLNPTVRAFVESYGLDCGAYRIARGGISERYAPDPTKPNVTRNRLLKGASVIGVDYDSSHPGDYSVTNTPGVTAYLLGHRLLGVPLDEAYLKRVEDAAAAKVAHHPEVRCWECSSEINCALSYDYWSDDSNWEQQMRGFSKWLAAIYRGAKRANPNVRLGCQVLSSNEQYRVSLAGAGAGQSGSFTRADPIYAAARTNYVTAAENPNCCFPYGTPETAATNLADAVDASVDDATVFVGEGTNVVRSTILLEKKITVKGIARDRAWLRAPTAYGPLIRFNHAGAVVADLTIVNGQAIADWKSSGSAAAVDIDAKGGTLAGCRVTECGLDRKNVNANMSSEVAALFLHSDKAVVTRCVVDNFDGIGLSTGKDLFDDRFHIRGNVTDVHYLSHYDWNYVGVTEQAYKKLPVSDEQFNEFIDVLCSSPFERIDYSENPIFYETEVQGHLYLDMNDGTRVELRLMDGGYVGCAELGWFFVRMPGDIFDAVLNSCQ